MMPRTATLLAGLVLGAALALPAQSAAPEPTGASAGEEIREQVARLQRELGALALSVDPDDEATSSEELIAQLTALRQRIDDLLGLLTALPPAADEVTAATTAPVAAEEAESPSLTPPASEQQAPTPTLPPQDSAPSTGGPQPDAAPPSEPACAELSLFDTNGDGVVSGLDRYWRFFRLWHDDGDGAIEARELTGLYDAGIKELTVALKTYRTVDGDAGDVRAAGRIRLELLGKRGATAELVLDADRLAGGGELELRDGSGAPLTGLQALSSEMAIAAADGASVPLRCP